MKFSYAWLKELLPALPPPKETAMLLTLHAFEVGELYREAGDWVLDLDILPNRMGDAASHEGLARELRAILAVTHHNRASTPLRYSKASVSERMGVSVQEKLAITVRDRRTCLFYSTRVLTGVRVAASPVWLQRRLRALGLESINNIVDATNFVMLETGQPLHAFDLDAIAPEHRGESRRHIIVRRARRRERITTLDGETKTLDSSMTVIADTNGPLAIAGVKGGKAAAIVDKTTAIAIEAAMFAPEDIYRTSRKVGIVTDASRRFEVQRSAKRVLPALERTTALIASLAGGRVARGVIQSGSVRSTVRRIAFSPDRVGGLLGMPISAVKARELLLAIGCTVVIPKKQKASAWLVTIPEERFDLEREEDLVEEVGRLAGYQFVSRTLPVSTLVPASQPEGHRWDDRFRDVLVAHGYHESMRMSFVNSALIQSFGFASTPLVTLENPQSQEMDALRPTTLINLAKQLEHEQRLRKTVRLFEIGDVFIGLRGGKVTEERALGILFSANTKEERQSDNAFYELKGVVQDLLEHAGLTQTTWEPIEFSTTKKKSHAGGRNFLSFLQQGALWHPGKTATVFIDGTPVGIVGEVRPKVSRAHRFAGNTALAELDMGSIVRVATEEHEYRPVSRYPELVRDIAVLVPERVLSDEVGQEMSRVGKALIRDINLFDYYEGEEIPEGMKSLAFHVVYQADDRTLSDAEADTLHKRIEQALTQRGWTVR